MFDLEGRTALVTGSTSGIGEAAAEALAGAGAHVVVSGRDGVRGGKVVAAIRERGGRADFVAADLALAEHVAALARDAERALGRVDILVNNAGLVQFGATAETDERTFDASYALNVKAPFFLTAALAPRMASRGWGRIVNITTMVAHFGMAGAALYGSSKAALHLLTQAWAAEFGSRGVTVNAVAPGPTRTPGAMQFGDAVEQLARAAPAGRAAAAAEIAAAVLYLSSTEAGFVNGATLAIDGGRAAT
jgi:NAD(P)-dependent dehydrogenase (short-subunit alcohol dehydrogenase family)